MQRVDQRTEGQNPLQILRIKLKKQTKKDKEEKQLTSAGPNF